MISHATEERLKNLLEKLAVIAEHRLDVIKVSLLHEPSNSIYFTDRVIKLKMFNLFLDG